ncbi:hypothetical protein J132_05031 [Termitomyces sp. J132]|nr:hypothetical protein J132_05031 [Termitomyces sp. J132]
MYKDAVARWANDVGRLKQLAITYREQAMEWHERLTHFEEEVKEKIEQERRERGQARLYWGDFIGSTQCTSSGRRKYHARLLNLTPSLFAIEACKSMPAKINGMTYDTPMYCEDKVMFYPLLYIERLTIFARMSQGREGVFGYWMIENDNMCSTYWDYVVRKDCSAPGSGERRYEAKLGDFHKGGDPEVLCLSTPITFHGQFFARPLACTDRGRGDNPQYWGIWNVPVEDC